MISDDQANLSERIAKVLVYRALAWCHQRQINLSVLQDRGKGEPPPPFACHWQRKNIFGCSFPLDRREEAIAWAKGALDAGYTVFYSMKRSGGTGFGHGLSYGLSPPDEEEADRWFTSHPVKAAAARKGKG